MAKPSLVVSDDDAFAGSTNREVSWGLARASLLGSGDRRMEASSYLSDGYGLRVAIEARQAGWSQIGELAHVWQPGRLKGIQVPKNFGLPFLAAGQVFEAQPSARKFLSPDKTPELEARFVNHGTILLSCSGTVGRVTVAHHPHDGHIITHDLLRIDPTDADARGWIYAFMRTTSFRDMATSSHYGHMIKHLEPDHVNALPIVKISEPQQAQFADNFDRMLAYRDMAGKLTDEAYALYESAVGLGTPETVSEKTFAVSIREVMASKRLRLDSTHYAADVHEIKTAMSNSADRVDLLPDVTENVWWPGRFRRVFGDNGTPYVSADELFDLNPPITKLIHSSLVRKADDYAVKSGWLLMARSGQVYGLNGRVLLVSAKHEKYFVSEDIIRIIPNTQKISPGYLQAVLSHPTLGRPIVISHAYGTSIPHLEPGDLESVPIPRFKSKTETEIGKRMAQAAELRSDADQLEDAMGAEAESIVSAFMHADL